MFSQYVSNRKSYFANRTSQIPSRPFPLFPVGYSSEKGYRCSVFPNDPNGVIGQTVAQVFFRSRSRQHIPGANRRYVFDGAMDGYSMPAMRIAGKRKRTVGQRKCNAAVRDSKSVEHFVPHSHPQRASPRPYRYKFHAHPLAERVVVEHSVEDFGGRKHVQVPVFLSIRGTNIGVNLLPVRTLIVYVSGSGSRAIPV